MNSRILSTVRVARPMFLLSIAGLLNACATHSALTPRGDLEIEVAEAGKETAEPQKYAILPEDELEIRFFYSPELDVTLPVRPDGFISLPYVGEVHVAGKSPEELGRDLESRYSRELYAPKISVIVRSFSARRIHVGGEVEEPGIFPLARGMTTLDSVFAAGGTKLGALLSEVLVIRRTPDGTYRVLKVDLEGVLEGRDDAVNARLLPYDAIYVPKSTIVHVNDWVELYIRRNIPVNIGLRPEFGAF